MRFQKLSLLIFLSFFIINSSSAHEVKGIGSLDVLLHMEPNDSPVINHPAYLFFAFNDSRKIFDLSLCNCGVKIESKGKVIFESKLESAEESYGSNVAKVDYIFPKKGIYNVKLSGESTNKSFDPFFLVYDVRIERESLDESPISPTSRNSINLNVYIYGLGIIGAVAIILLGIGKSNIKKFMKKITPVIILGLFLVSSSALAHVTVKPDKVGLGAFQTFTVSVPSEKEFSTTEVRLSLPDGLEHVTPTVKPGWRAEVLVHELPDGEHPYEIKWTGGQIPEHFRDEFSFSAKVPSVESKLVWKAYQKYSDGSVVSWDLSAEEQPKKADGSPDFSKSGPYTLTAVVDDLSPATLFDINSLISVVAILLALVSLILASKRKR